MVLNRREGYTVDVHFTGERAQRAKQVAASIAANMEHSLPT